MKCPLCGSAEWTAEKKKNDVHIRCVCANPRCETRWLIDGAEDFNAKEDPVSIFKPGDRIQFKATEKFMPSYVIGLLVGGYCVEGAWQFFSATREWTSKDFELTTLSLDESVAMYKRKYGHLDG